MPSRFLRSTRSLRKRGWLAQNDVRAELAAAQRGDLRCGLECGCGRIVLQMHAAQDLDARGHGSGELTFHVIVVLLIRVHAVVPVKRLEQEMSDVAVMEGRSFIRKLFLLAGGEIRLAGRASPVKELQARLVASQPKGAIQ
jgi:hypothetical protein